MTIIATIAAAALVSLFLYKNFYRTITQSEEILILRQKVAPLSVEMNKFNEVMKKIKEKNKIRPITAINDPFTYGDNGKQTSNAKNEIENEVKGKNTNPSIPQFQ